MILAAGATVFAATLAIAPASAQTLNLDANGGLVIGGAEMQGSGLSNASGSSLSQGGTIISRTSMSETGSRIEGTIGIDSNQNRTNVALNAEMYNGASQSNSIKTAGVNAGGSSSISGTSITGSMDFIGGAVNVQGSGSITFP